MACSNMIRFHTCLKHNVSFVKFYSSQYQKFESQNNGLSYEGQRPVSSLQRTLLALGSAVAALNDPLRSDMVAALGETTGYEALRKLQLQMLNHKTGCQILSEKPIIDSKSLDVEKLKLLPTNTLGYAYATFMSTQNITSDTRPLVHYVDDAELAYVMKRYRQIHDFVHLLLGFSVTVPAEIVVKWFEFIHFGFPMTALSSVFGPLACSAKERVEIRKRIPWAIYNGLHTKLLLNVYFEKNMEQDFVEFRKQLGIVPCPNGIL